VDSVSLLASNPTEMSSPSPTETRYLKEKPIFIGDE